VRGQRWFVWGLVVLFAALSVQYALKAAQGRSAIVRWHPQLLSMENGEDISQRYLYPNPPIMAVLLDPLAKLPPLASALLWFALKVGMALLTLRWVFQLVEELGRPFPPWAKALTVVLSLRPIMGDLQHGNVNLFILFLIVAGLHAFRHRRDLLAGGLLGLATACKVTPALFLPYLVWKRAWRTLAGFALGLALFLWPGVVPALVLGVHENQRQLASWYREMVYPFVVEGKVTSEQNNQSLPGLVSRLATHSPSYSKYENDVYTPTAYDNVVDLNPRVTRWLVKGAMALFALLAVWCCRTPTAARGGWRLSAEFGLVVLGMLLFSERTWKHHGVTLMLPFAVVCYFLGTAAVRRGMRIYLVGSLLAVAGLMASTSTGLLPKEWAKDAQVYGAYVVAYVILAAALMVLLRRSLYQPAAPATGAKNPSLALRAGKSLFCSPLLFLAVFVANVFEHFAASGGAVAARFRARFHVVV
jgi:hypothetical protein